MSSFLIEKSVIAVSLLVGYPLFFLDKELFGNRRFGWLLASTCGLVSLIFVGAGNETNDPDLSTLLDKITVATVCVSAIPHINKLIKESPWLGLSMIPPIFIVINLSTSTSVGSEAYWRLRCFMHATVFFMPYQNHLPSDKTPEEKQNDGDTGAGAEKDEARGITDVGGPKKKAKGKTNKHK
jgi:hypothetical protein